MIVCMECARPLKTQVVGATLEEVFKDNGKPYRLFAVDILVCICGREVAVTGPNQQPIAEHFQENYAEIRARKPPRITVRV